MGGDPPHVFRGAGVDQGDRSTYRPQSQHGAARVAFGRAAALSAAAAAVEARPVPGGDPPAAALRCAPAGQADPRAAGGAGLRGRQVDPRRLLARGATALPAPAHLPAHLVPARCALPVRSLAAVARGPGWERPDAARLCRCWLSALLARRRGHVGLLEGGARPFVRDRRLSGEAGCAAGDAGLGPRGRAACGRRAADGAVRRFLRRAPGRLALPRAQGPAVEGRGRAAAGLPGDELRAGPRVRRRARLPGAARPLVSRARQPPLPPHAALPSGRPAGPRRFR